MSAVLLELGLMDSGTDVPIILSEDYANKCAEAIVEVLVKKGNLKKPAKLHKVQVGAFADLAKAENLCKELKAKGYDAIIV
jgi:cell division protein FtsN